MYYDALENDKGEKAEHFRMKGIPSDTIKREAFHITVTELKKIKIRKFDCTDFFYEFFTKF